MMIKENDYETFQPLVKANDYDSRLSSNEPPNKNPSNESPNKNPFAYLKAKT
jgi:hypothetical protein